MNVSDFSKQTALNKKALVVEGRAFWVCPELLACHSEYFKNLFFGEWVHRSEVRIILEDVEAGPFLEYIRALHSPRGIHRNEAGFSDYLSLVSSHQVKSLLNKARKELRYHLHNLNIHSPTDRNLMMKALGDIFILEGGEKNTGLYKFGFRKVMRMCPESLAEEKNVLLPALFNDIIMQKMMDCADPMKIFNFAPCGTCGKLENPRYDDCCVCHLKDFSFT